MNVNPQSLFEYFVEMNKPLDVEELMDRFDWAKYEELSPAIRHLSDKGYLNEFETLKWQLTDKALRDIAEDAERLRQEAYTKTLELEKTKIDLELAKKMLKEYPATKLMARISLAIAISLALLELVRLLKQ